ncbi:hypothetical protein GCM10010394_13520 [Streptomyces crystallinus]|uniref:Uncharacterized protein n=1 Tax=Streptomyces crystallinus TaxID=68191 RepID=A0ABN1F9K4_9ACTN
MVGTGVLGRAEGSADCGFEGLGFVGDGFGDDGFDELGFDVGSTSDGGELFEGEIFEGDGSALDLEGAEPEAEGDGPGASTFAATTPVALGAAPVTPSAKLGTAVPTSNTTDSTAVSTAVSDTIGNPHVFRLRPTASPS